MHSSLGVSPRRPQVGARAPCGRAFMGSTADNESLAVVATAMHRAELTVSCVQATFNLGHTVDTTEPIEWPDGVLMQREDHLTRTCVEGIKSKLPKLVLEFCRPHMATVTIHPSGKVEVTRASSETAAQASAETVRNSLLRPDDAGNTSSKFRITQMVAKYDVLPREIHQQALYKRLEEMYYRSGVPVGYEPELRTCVQLVLNQGATDEGVSKGRVIFEFFSGKIIVRAIGLGAGGSVMMQELFLKVFNEVPIADLLRDELPSGSLSTVVKSKQRVPDSLDALDKAIKKMVGGGPLKGLGRRPAGGFISRHRQIQKWLREKHPDLTLPDYNSEWGNGPGRANPRVWAGTSWAVFWAERMCPVFDEMAAQKAEKLKRKRDEQDPAEESKTLYDYADRLIDGNVTNTESPADATSRLNLYGVVVQLAEERKKQHDQLLEDALQDAWDELEVPVTRSLADKVDSAEEQPKGAYRSLGSGDDESAGARRALAGHILPWPGTARHRSSAGVEVPPGTKLTVGEANEASCDVASRLLQALGAFASPETADLNNECVRICKLIIAN